jgi:hypothetical protein
VKSGIAYHNQTQYYSAAEVSNVASGFSSLLLMKSGGNVGIGTASPTANLENTGTTKLTGTVTLGGNLAMPSTARVVGGSTNGLAVRNAANTRDNFRVYDSGSHIYLDNGSAKGHIGITTASGELPAGAYFGGGTGFSGFLASDDSGTAGVKSGIAYYNQSQYYSAAEVANVSSGFSNLLLMRSGGKVGIGNTAPGSALHVNGGVQVGNPTGGDQGSGSINVAGDIYKNGTPMLARLEKAYATIAALTKRIERLEAGAKRQAGKAKRVTPKPKRKSRKEKR